MNESKLPPPRAESERQLACVSCGAVKGEGKCSNGCVFPEPSKGEQGLLPCPFDGGEAVYSVGETGDGKPWQYVECLKCGASTEPEIWNTRAGVTQQSVESVWDEAIGIVEDLVCAPQFDGNWRNGYSHAQNDAFRALELAKAESLAAQNKDQKLG